MRIERLDPVDCHVVKSTGAERKWLRRLMSYKSVYYRPGQFKKIRTESRTPLLVNMGGKGKPPMWCFPAGFLPKVEEAARADGVEVDIIYKTNERLKPTASLAIKGVKFRDDQKRLIQNAIKMQRGVLVSPTGSGKTHLLMGILCQYPKARVLVVTHSLDIISQTVEVLRAHGLRAGHLGKSVRANDNIAIASRQTLMGSVEYKTADGKKYRRQELKEDWAKYVRSSQIVIIDEVHLFGDMDGQYASLFRNTLAPMRLGLTATEPPEKEKVAMCLEGVVGPTIGKVTFEEGQELNIISEVRLELISVRVNTANVGLSTYREMLQAGLYRNRARNLSIMSRAKELVESGRTVLVFINALVHGDHLMDVAELLKFNVVYVEGLTKVEVRDEIKRKFMTGEVGCVISSKVWREGVNIPNLGAVIMAGGGKAELGTLQTVGRALRRTDTKEEAVVVDFLDPYRWLAEHTVQRLSIYKKHGWL